MDRIDRLQAHVDALEQQTAHWQHQTQALAAQTHTLARQLRWWRGIACSLVALHLLSLMLPSGEATDAQSGTPGRPPRRLAGQGRGEGAGAEDEELCWGQVSVHAADRHAVA